MGTRNEKGVSGGSRENSAPGPRAWVIFAACSFGFMLSMFYRNAIPVIAPRLLEDLSLNPSQLSHVSAAFFYAFALSQIPLGMILDRAGNRVPMSLLMTVGALGALMFAWSDHLGSTVTARAIMGVGMSGALMGTLSLLAAWFPTGQFATLSGFFVALGCTGQVLATTPLALLSESWGWRAALELAGGVTLVYAVFFYWVVRDRPPESPRPAPAAQGVLRGLARVLGDRAYWIISLTTFFRYGCLMALQALWAGPFLIQGLGFSSVAAGNVLLGLNLGYVCGLPFFGRVSDAWVGSRKLVVMPSIWVLAGLFFVLMVWPPGAANSWIHVLFFCLGLAASPGQILYAHIRELMPVHLAATAMTGINVFTMIGPAVIMQITSLFVAADPEAASGVEVFRTAWGFMGGGLALVGCLYARVPDRRRTNG